MKPNGRSVCCSVLTFLLSGWIRFILPRQVVKSLLNLKEAVDRAAAGDCAIDFDIQGKSPTRGQRAKSGRAHAPEGMSRSWPEEIVLGTRGNGWENAGGTGSTAKKAAPWNCQSIPLHAKHGSSSPMCACLPSAVVTQWRSVQGGLCRTSC